MAAITALHPIIAEMPRSAEGGARELDVTCQPQSKVWWGPLGECGDVHPAPVFETPAACRQSASPPSRVASRRATSRPRRASLPRRPASRRAASSGRRCEARRRSC
eukprot:910301-Prymnesium_polylepis.1